jgi:DNA-binding GntR family transcriptional regulator
MAARCSATLVSARSYVTKTELALHELRDRILRLTLEPGQPIVIDETARQLGISPIPVREALQMLAAEGLIEIRPHIGVIVAPITRRSVVELFTLLEGLETAVCRHAVAAATADDLADLTGLLEQLDTVRVNREADRWARLNGAFHHALSALAGLPRVNEELQRALDHWDRVRRVFFADVLSHRAAEAQTEHWQILDAVKAHNSDRVEALLRAHNRVALDHYLKLLPERGR